jgi:hypothetical protein
MSTEHLDAQAESAAPAMRSYATANGLSYYENWSLPQPTQILRHGYMQGVPNLVTGRTREFGEIWLAHAFYAVMGARDDRRYFTLFYVRAPARSPFAMRVLCHDRDLTDTDVSNPDSERQVIELDDAAVPLESEEFAKRYAVSTDHDADEVHVWQLFDPDLVDWLTREAPEDFSFELQDGALCCFVPGIVAEVGALVALTGAAKRVYERVGEIAAGAGDAEGNAPPAAGTRDDIVEGELAEHAFAEVPKSVRAAAYEFGHGPIPTDRAWKLGAEAFFRAYAESIGLERIDNGTYTAAHLEVSAPGALTAVAKGPIRSGGPEGYLLWTTDEDDDAIGWQAIVADVPPGANTFTFATMPSVARAKDEDDIDMTGSNRAIILWKPDGGPHGRNRKHLDAFMATAGPLMAEVVAASVRV